MKQIADNSRGPGHSEVEGPVPLHDPFLPSWIRWSQKAHPGRGCEIIDRIIVTCWPTFLGGPRPSESPNSSVSGTIIRKAINAKNSGGSEIILDSSNSISKPSYLAYLFLGHMCGIARRLLKGKIKLKFYPEFLYVYQGVQTHQVVREQKIDFFHRKRLTVPGGRVGRRRVTTSVETTVVTLEVGGGGDYGPPSEIFTIAEFENTREAHIFATVCNEAAWRTQQYGGRFFGFRSSQPRPLFQNEIIESDTSTSHIDNA